jgi:putative oxidoreductase
MGTLQAVGALVGRVLLVAIFIYSGYGKLMDPAGTKQFMAGVGHLPHVNILYVCAVIVELGGGLLVAVGFKARFAAAALFLFLIPVTLTFHTAIADPMQRLHLLTNLAILGGLLMVTVHGPGRISMDGQLCCRAPSRNVEPATTRP